MTDDNPVALRAENNPKFYSRFKWLGLGALAFMVWSIYDATIRFPDQKVRSEALLHLAEETLPESRLQELATGVHGHGDLYLKVKGELYKSPELQAAWEEKAAAEGWPKAPFKKLRTEGDILGNYGFAVLGAFAGVWFLLTVYRTNGRWFELNDGVITSRWGETFNLDQVTAIDKRQWRDKGIARVRYQDENGRSRTFVVDNYKYYKRTTDEILRQIELGAGIEKIVNGKPEPEPVAKEEPSETVDASN